MLLTAGNGILVGKCVVICTAFTGAEHNNKASLAVIGSWSMQVKLLSLPGLSPLVTEELGSEIIPRSVALADFEGQVRIYCVLLLYSCARSVG